MNLHKSMVAFWAAALFSQNVNCQEPFKSNIEPVRDRVYIILWTNLYTTDKSDLNNIPEQMRACKYIWWEKVYLVDDAIIWTSQDIFMKLNSQYVQELKEQVDCDGVLRWKLDVADDKEEYVAVGW